MSGLPQPDMITVRGVAAGSRLRVYASTKLLKEWMAIRYAGLTPYYELRLGPTSVNLVGQQVTPQLEAMLRVANWYADAVVVTPTQVDVIEAKVQADPSAVGQVLFYRRLIFTTPALSGVSNLPVQPVVLFAENDSQVTPFATALGCRVDIYTPSWITEYLVQRQFRRRGAALPATTEPAPEGGS